MESELSAANGRSPKALPLLFGLVAALVLSAWLNRFVQDDAFISFVYARNLVEGHGLTFNAGEYVEGYTNFLWTLMIAAGIRAGLDPIAWSYLLGLAFFAGSLLATYGLAAEISGSATTGLVATLLLGTNFSFNAYATGGLETQMQAFLIVVSVLLSLRATRGAQASPRLLALASCSYGLAVLTRLDSAACLVLPGLVVAAKVARDEGGAGARLARAGAFVAPATLLVAPWLAWKISYYGGVLPNTFYVKAASSASLLRGIHYVYRFFATYWLLPLAVVTLLALPRQVLATLRRGAPWGLTLVATVTLWCAYVASVGGDFMEFRFMVPILPLIIVLLSWCLFAVVDDRRLRAAVVSAVVLGSLFHATTYFGVRGIETIDSLAIHMEPDGGDWDEVGRSLGGYFGPGSGVVIAVGPSGAIPYYSRLQTVDMRGLVDPWVARNGLIVSSAPGHQRMAPLSYLVDRGVNLVVGHPQVVPRQGGLPEAYTRSSMAALGLADVATARFPGGARILAIPMSEDRLLLALYLVPSPEVERAIAEHGWTTVPLVDSIEPLR